MLVGDRLLSGDQRFEPATQSAERWRVEPAERGAHGVKRPMLEAVDERLPGGTEPRDRAAAIGRIVGAFNEPSSDKPVDEVACGRQPDAHPARELADCRWLGVVDSEEGAELGHRQVEQRRLIRVDRRLEQVRMVADQADDGLGVGGAFLVRRHRRQCSAAPAQFLSISRFVYCEQSIALHRTIGDDIPVRPAER